MALSAEEQAATVKMRIGGDPIVADIAKLTKDLTLAQRLRPLASAVEQLSQRLSDTVLEAQSECWWAATAYYTSLCRVADADPVLEAALRPIIDFFAVGRRKKPAP